jgi:hypothetical protein
LKVSAPQTLKLVQYWPLSQTPVGAAHWTVGPSDVHTPSFVEPRTALQTWQLATSPPAQAFSQHTLSTQKPELHTLASRQG